MGTLFVAIWLTMGVCTDVLGQQGGEIVWKRSKHTPQSLGVEQIKLQDNWEGGGINVEGRFKTGNNIPPEGLIYSLEARLQALREGKSIPLPLYNGSLVDFSLKETTTTDMNSYFTYYTRTHVTHFWTMHRDLSSRFPSIRTFHGKAIGHGGISAEIDISPSSGLHAQIFCPVRGLINGACTYRKAEGTSGTPNPTGDAFHVDYLSHEIAHQFGADHTFNGVRRACANNRASSLAYEPGSGSTIMGYAGICGNDNTALRTSPYFHLGSLDQIQRFMDYYGG
eukprot:jgi/Bigna1/143794/aug1.81_g18502